jgi:solute carrier family 25 (mitochondrial phosphate transporter), member 3
MIPDIVINHTLPSLLSYDECSRKCGENINKSGLRRSRGASTNDSLLPVEEQQHQTTFEPCTLPVIFQSCTLRVQHIYQKRRSMYLIFLILALMQLICWNGDNGIDGPIYFSLSAVSAFTFTSSPLSSITMKSISRIQSKDQRIRRGTSNTYKSINRISNARLFLDTTSSSLSQNQHQDTDKLSEGSALQSITNLHMNNNNNNNNIQQSQSSLPIPDKIPLHKDVELIKNNNVDGVIRWKDVLRSTQPISCSLDDEECLKRQRIALKIDSSSLDSNDDGDIVLTWTDRKNLSLAIIGTIVAVGTLIVQSGPGAWRYYVAGAICATASHVIPVPVDTVKTRKQVDPKFAKLSFAAAFVRIWQQEGIQGLLAGLGPTAIGYALEGGIKFGVYEAMKPIVSKILCRLAMLSPYSYFLQSKILIFAICAAISGVAASIVLCPMEALRIRMVANPNSRNGWFRTALRMIKTEGMMSLVKGMEPMIYKQVPYTITKNVSFDIITRSVYSTLQTTWRMTTIGPMTKFIVPFLAAAAASILSCLSSQPGDVLLSLVNAQQYDVRRTRDIIRDVLHSEKGWKGFYIGTKARLLHVGIVVTLQLLIYDLVKRICGIAATGIAK